MLFQFFQNGAAAIVVDENAHGFAAMGGFGCFSCQQKVKEFKFKTKSLVNLLQILLVVLFCTIDGEFIRLFSSDFDVTLIQIQIILQNLKVIDSHRRNE